MIFQLADLIPSRDCGARLPDGQYVRAMHEPFRGGFLASLGMAATLALSACVSVPPTIPTLTPQQVGAVGAELAATNLSPADYANDGMLLNLWACNAYLLGQAQLSGNFGVAAQGTSLGTSVAAGLLGLTGAGAPAVALAGVSGGGFASALGILGNNTGIPYSAPTAEKVQEAMQTYAEAVWVSPPSSLAQAAMIVEGHRYLCTPPGISWLASQSISSAQISAAPSPGPSLLQSRAIGAVEPARGTIPTTRFALPVITINGRH